MTTPQKASLSIRPVNFKKQILIVNAERCYEQDYCDSLEIIADCHLQRRIYNMPVLHAKEQNCLFLLELRRKKIDAS